MTNPATCNHNWEMAFHQSDNLYTRECDLCGATQRQAADGFAPNDDSRWQDVDRADMPSGQGDPFMRDVHSS